MTTDPADRIRDLDDGAPVVVTGAAGFVGFHLSRRLLEAGLPVLGIDSLTPYYDVRLKRARLERLAPFPGFRFVEADLADRSLTARLFADARPRRVAHLAAQAGVRHSLENPHAYADSNLVGFLNVLEAARALDLAHLVYASSSSVYGGSTALPYSTRDPAVHPVSLYAATKRANELMAHAYCHLYGFPATGLRFFTVYGPWGRPDMAYWKFTEAIAEGRPIDVYNHGDMGRDFTHVDDVVEPVLRLLASPPAPDPGFDRAAPDAGASWAPHRVLNIGAARPEKLTDMIAIIERALGRTADKRLLPMQPGDVRETWADVADLDSAVGFRPAVALEDGLTRFVDWWLSWRAAG